MGDKCNCYRFSPRDSLSGAVAQIADYLSKHPGWNETELRAFVDDLISSAGVETFNGRSGNVTLNKDDVNNLLIANCYFAEADETIESIDVLALYKLGIRIVFTQYSSEVDGYTLAYGIEYYPATDTAKAYLFSSGSGGAGAVVSVNGKTGTVVLKANDILMNNGDSVEDAVSNAKAIANAAYSPDNTPPYPVTSVNGKTGTVTGLYDKNNPPPYPVNSVNSKTGSVLLKVVDVSNGNSTDENAYMFIDESDDYPDVIASDSSKLGGKAPEYYLQPMNLLDNSDFTNPVNQRGVSSGTLTDWNYFIDRWRCLNNCTYELTDSGIRITGGAIAQSLAEGAKDNGKTYTFAVCLSTGTIRILAYTLPETDVFGWTVFNNKEYTDVTLEAGGDSQNYNVLIKKKSDFTIRWAALYEGSYTAETLPPYVPKGYVAELAECDMYYRPLGDNVMSVIGMTSSDGGNALLKSTRPMRDNIKPTIINNGTLYARVNGADYTVTNVRINKSDNSGVEILITAENVPAKQAAILHGSALLALSRDL